jgi:hypothetical protein
MCNQPSSCNCANINPRPFDLDQTAMLPSLRRFTNKRSHTEAKFFLRSFSRRYLASNRTETPRLPTPGTGAGALPSPAIAWWPTPPRLMLDFWWPARLGPWWSCDGRRCNTILVLVAWWLFLLSRGAISMIIFRISSSLELMLCSLVLFIKISFF